LVYKKFTLSIKYILLPISGLFLTLFYISFGQIDSTFNDSIKIIINSFHNSFVVDPVIEKVILYIRIPRAITAVICGAGLAISGCALQGIFSNPLIGPQIIGVYSGAAFGGALGILISEKSYLILLLAFGFGILSMVIVFFIARVKGFANRLTLVLAGIVSSSFFLSLVSLVKFLADPDDKLPAITYWLMGTFSTSSYEKISIVSPIIIVSVFILILFSFRIDVLNLGDDQAKSLGINVELNRWIIISLVTIICASVVSIAGVIGWVGLVIPHIARSISLTNHRSLLINSAIFGAYYMLVIDLLCRGFSAMEIPLGVVTALIGAPFFAILLRKRLKGI
jgi:iron complex transport system permease protein